jgi:hypothetical protein
MVGANFRRLTTREGVGRAPRREIAVLARQNNLSKTICHGSGRGANVFGNCSQEGMFKVTN